jgi:hypothetical protein
MAIMQQNFCPIAIFAFKRPDHLGRALASLRQSPEFTKSPLYIFCDGPRNEADAAMTAQVKQVADSWQHPNKTVVARERNLGLAKSISGGIDRLCDEHGRAIAIEEDLTVSPVYLQFMNDALNRYSECERVMQVAGHVYPARFRSPRDAVMLPMSSTLGWGTWQRAWRQFDPTMSRRNLLDSDPDLRWRFDLEGAYPYYKMLQAQLSGNVDSWGIKWYLSVFLAGGLCVFPTKSLVAHEFDGTGTHCATPQFREQPLRMTPITTWPEPIADPEALNDFKKFIRRDRRAWVKVFRYLRSRFGKT